MRGRITGARAQAFNGTKESAVYFRATDFQSSTFRLSIPIWQSMFVVKEVPQKASIQFWQRRRHLRTG
jgi:hypothetical protein